MWNPRNGDVDEELGRSLTRRAAAGVLYCVADGGVTDSTSTPVPPKRRLVPYAERRLACSRNKVSSAVEHLTIVMNGKL